MFRTFASAEFKHSMVDYSYIQQFKHLLKLYKDWCNANADNMKEMIETIYMVVICILVLVVVDVLMHFKKL